MTFSRTVQKLHESYSLRPFEQLASDRQLVSYTPTKLRESFLKSGARTTPTDSFPFGDATGAKLRTFWPFLRVHIFEKVTQTQGSFTW